MGEFVELLEAPGTTFRQKTGSLFVCLFAYLSPLERQVGRFSQFTTICGFQGSGLPPPFQMLGRLPQAIISRPVFGFRVNTKWLYSLMLTWLGGRVIAGLSAVCGLVEWMVLSASSRALLITVIASFCAVRTELLALTPAASICPTAASIRAAISAIL
jgi:hypothetical protein